MVDLPPELWREMTSYLEDTDMKLLLGVNHLLRGLALDHIYEQAVIDLRMLGEREHLDQIGRLGYVCDNFKYCAEASLTLYLANF
ncbi:hypothetical protein CPB83DRAFT_858323 [Crepidotus variabilis]|uniref:F-box domain-containing protein n=1 Tax=Crepidotus variabilis TaxID=179855 RepID=A0A9P6EBS7_9AGAR|nr:hypothetical protein CPB83DRAFT_858323 [Crepidotus variabilis]